MLLGAINTIRQPHTHILHLLHTHTHIRSYTHAAACNTLKCTHCVYVTLRSACNFLIIFHVRRIESFANCPPLLTKCHQHLKILLKCLWNNVSIIKLSITMLIRYRICSNLLMFFFHDISHIILRCFSCELNFDLLYVLVLQTKQNFQVPSVCVYI